MMTEAPNLSGMFQTDPVAVPGTGNWTRVLLLTLDPRRHSGRTVLTGLVGVAAITGLKVSRAATRDGQHVDIAVDADLDNANVEVQASFPASAFTTGAGGNFQLSLNNSGAAEWALWAKAASATTVQTSGSVS
jgi:hypothetical protein